ncbi:MAG TPA: type II secretion system protein [Candidatus Binatia bacterium]|jgi:prepilin-type N-terminal cleavage/methylation domain-containing protein|nr:type II secretion system protein [Candidatus Binatia bacterium]
MRTHKKDGFTLIELLLVIALIGLIASIAMIGMRTGPEKRLDLKRVTDIDQLQKALGLYAASQKAFPIMTGCVNGSTDLVSTELIAKGALALGTVIKDPSFPTDVTQCYYYTSTTGSTYSLRYTLQTTSSAGTQGNHTVQP